MPEGWGWCKLIDVCHIFGRIGFRGYTKDDLVSDDGAITLSPSNIIDGQMNYDNCTYISWNKYEESPEIQIANGDILLVKTGSSFGKCAYVCNLPQKATINPQFVVLKHILCNPRFLTYILQSGYARRNYDEFVLGTAIPTFTQVVLGDMYIPLPSLQEQQRIVNVIGQWFKLIDDLEKEQNGLQRILQQTKSKILELAIHGKLVPQEPTDEPAINLLKRINPKFTPCDNAHDTNQLPKSWCWATLGNIFQHNTGKALNKSDSLEGTLKPYLTTSNVYWDSFDFTEVKQMYFKDSEIDKCTVQKGDLLVCEGGDIGRAAIWNYDHDICIQNHIHRLRAKGMIDHRLYLYVLMLYKWTDKIHGKGIGLQGLSSGLLDKLIIPVSPYNEQKRIVAKIEELFAVLDEIKESLEA